MQITCVYVALALIKKKWNRGMNNDQRPHFETGSAKMQNKQTSNDVNMPFAIKTSLKQEME